MAKETLRQGAGGQPVGPAEKYSDPSEFPPLSDDPGVKHYHFYKRARDDGKELPYFYTIEVDDRCGALTVYHGGPGRCAPPA